MTRLKKKGSFFMAPAVLSIALTLVLWNLLREAETQLEQVAFLERISGLSAQLHSAYFEASYSSLIGHLTGSERSLERFDQLMNDINDKERQLKNSLNNTETEVKLVRQALKDGESSKALMMKIRNELPRELGGTLSIRQYQKKGFKAVKVLTEDYKVINDYCSELASKYRSDASRSRQLAACLLVLGVCANIALSLLLMLFFGKNISGRLEVIADNVLRIARQSPLLPPVSGDDEIKQLDKSFRSMAKELEEAGKKERALMDNAASVLLSLDADLKFIKLSAASERLWGYHPDELVSNRLITVLKKEQSEGELDLFRTAIANRAETTFDTTLVRKDNELIEVRWNVFWSESERALFCVAYDVTREKELQRLKQQLLDMVAHDLRNPMTSIQNTLNMMSMGLFGELSEKLLTRVQKTEKEADRLVRMINDLLDFERLESGGIEIVAASHRVGSIVDDSAQAVGSLRADVKVEVITSEALDENVEVDSDRVVQVLVNLLSNAIKFSPAGSIVSIETFIENSFVKICVVDRGPGILSEHQELIFERFKMIEKQKNEKKMKGTGLGLAIAKQIVELHGGKIGVESVFGSGSTFWFTMPLSPRDQPIVDKQTEISEPVV